MPNKTKQNTKNSTEQICSQPLYKSQTTHHTQPTTTNNNHWPAAQAPTTQQDGRRSHGVEREPDSVSARITYYAQPKHAPTPTTHTRAVNTCRHKKTNNTTQQATLLAPHKTGLPRKEVIQPHLPVRLPCYDFVPIANPTFDHSPRKSG